LVNAGAQTCDRRRDGGTFLLAEVASPRTGPPLLDALRDEGADRTVVSQPDLTDSTANALRRRVLSAYRGFPDQGVFTAMPVETTWHWVTLSPAELSAVRYLDWPYWTKFSGGSRLVIDGARRLGPWHQQPDGSIYRRIAEKLRAGVLPPPLVLVGRPGGPQLVVLEGHVRLTGLLMCPEALPDELQALLGTAKTMDK
jgi:hypothetical protein